MDDFLIPVRVARDGRRIVFAGGAVAREDAARDVAAEVSRRIRIGIGAGQVLRRERWLYAARRASAADPGVPVPQGGALARAPARRSARRPPRSSRRPCGRSARRRSLLAALLLAVARAKPRLGGAAGRLYYFGVLNVALALGVAAGLAGYARPVWARTARS